MEKPYLNNNLGFDANSKKVLQIYSNSYMLKMFNLKMKTSRYFRFNS
jgi:hypothetical protein